MLNILAGNTICKQVKMLSEREKEVMSKIQFYVSISGASVLFYGRKRSVMFDMVKREKVLPYATLHQIGCMYYVLYRLKEQFDILENMHIRFLAKNLDEAIDTTLMSVPTDTDYLRPLFMLS